jgi:hypothetical protein
MRDVLYERLLFLCRQYLDMRSVNAEDMPRTPEGYVNAAFDAQAQLDEADMRGMPDYELLAALLVELIDRDLRSTDIPRSGRIDRVRH